MKRQGKKRIILGVTGSFGSGKTTVARNFKSLGAKIIDADRIAHRIIKPGSKIYRRIINTFGKDILKKNRAIDRDKLAKVVFNNKNLLNRLNKIVHPEVIRTIEREIKASSQEVVVLDVPLLIEAGLRRLVDKLIVVKITQEKQIERVLHKVSLGKRDILKRIRHQVPLKDKVRIADFVIDNSGTIKNTKKQVNKIRRLLWKN